MTKTWKLSKFPTAIWCYNDLQPWASIMTPHAEEMVMISKPYYDRDWCIKDGDSEIAHLSFVIATSDYLVGA